jgi:hypothetical protein
VLRGPANFPTLRANYSQNSTSKPKRNGRVSEKADRDSVAISFTRARLEHRLDLLAQFRLILMPVRTQQQRPLATPPTGQSGRHFFGSK